MKTNDNNAASSLHVDSAESSKGKKSPLKTVDKLGGKKTRKYTKRKDAKVLPLKTLKSKKVSEKPEKKRKYVKRDPSYWDGKGVPGSAYEISKTIRVKAVKKALTKNGKTGKMGKSPVTRDTDFAMKIVIDKRVPIPTHILNRTSKYPFFKLERKGHSFALPVKFKDRLSSAANMFMKNNKGVKLVIDTVTNPKVARVFRLDETSAK